MANERFEVLDGLRGIAALAVLGHHAEQVRSWTHVVAGATTYFSNGYLAVDFFFMLSGFVIGAAYEDRLRSGRMHAVTYMKIRMIRLYPALLCGAVLGLLVGAARHLPINVPEAFVAQLLFIPFVVSSEMYPLDVVQWSLLLELLANLIHAVFAPLLSLAALVVVTICGLAALVFTNMQFGSLGVGWGLDNYWGGFARVAFAFPAGLLLYRLHARGLLPKVSFLAAPAIVALVVILVAPWGTGLRHSAVVALAFPAIIVSVLYAKAPGRLGTLNSALGELSYPLYCIHFPLLWALALGVSTLVAPALRDVVWAAGLVLIPIASLMLGRYFEEPLRRRLMTRWSPNPKATVTQG